MFPDPFSLPSLPFPSGAWAINPFRKEEPGRKEEETGLPACLMKRSRRRRRSRIQFRLPSSPPTGKGSSVLLSKRSPFSSPSFPQKLALVGLSPFLSSHPLTASEPFLLLLFLSWEFKSGWLKEGSAFPSSIFPATTDTSFFPPDATRKIRSNETIGSQIPPTCLCSSCRNNASSFLSIVLSFKLETGKSVLSPFPFPPAKLRPSAHL